MPKESYLNQYKSPNIVIIPTSLCYPPSPKKPKMETPLQSTSPQYTDLSFLDDLNIDEIVEYLNDCNSNDAIQDNKEVCDKNVSQKSCKQKDITISIENNINQENNDENNVIDIDDINTTNRNFKESELQNKKESDIFLDTDINNISNAQDGDTVSIKCNSQIQNDLIIEGNKAELSSCKEMEIDKNIIEHDLKEPLTNTLDLVKSDCKEICEPVKEFVDNNTYIPITDKKNNQENKSQNIHKHIKSNIISRKVVPKQNTKIKAQPKSVVQRQSDTYISAKLEYRMFNYLHEKFSVESVLHTGQFSKIFKCKNSAGNQYAIKMLHKVSDRYTRGICKEKMLLDIQADIPRENSFCIYCFYGFGFNGLWCFLMEFYPKNLQQVIFESQKPFHIDLVQDLARQLVGAVTLLRNNNIVHSDIKPSHILLNSSLTVLKLCGFDCSYYIEETYVTTNICSVNYRPPEVIVGHSAGFSVDVWSTALVLHEMATGRKLFSGSTNWDILRKQISTLGRIPQEMLEGSNYKTRYFANEMYRRTFDPTRKTALLTHNKFNKSQRLSRTLYGAYYQHWEPVRTKTQKINDFHKINLLNKLLEKMLFMHPDHRICIEFVYANPFIYQMLD